MGDNPGVKRFEGLRAVYSRPQGAAGADGTSQPLLSPGAPRSDNTTAMRSAAAAKAADREAERVRNAAAALGKSAASERAVASRDAPTAEAAPSKRKAQFPFSREEKVPENEAVKLADPGHRVRLPASFSPDSPSQRNSVNSEEGRRSQAGGGADVVRPNDKKSQMIKHASSIYASAASNESDARLRSWALKKLTDAVRVLIFRKIAACAPLTFRTNSPLRPHQSAKLANWGLFQFSGSAMNQPAHWLHLADTRSPYKDSAQYASETLDLMEKHWEMSPASVLISITGGAQDFVLPPRLDKAFKYGLAKAAQATNAWVFTGGTDSGVMQLVGQALAEYSAQVQCIGVVTHGVVHGRSSMNGVQGGTVEILRTQENSKDGANLEPNHTHFLLIDDGREGAAAWGGEIAFRFELEREHCMRRKVPRVLLVVQGGPGTLTSILKAVEGDSPVVLVRDSGGVAMLLDHFLKTYKDESSQWWRKGEILPQFEKAYGPKREILLTIAELDTKNSKVTSFGLTENATAELDLHLLNAVINDTSQVTPELRLRLAVEWNRKDVVERVLRETMSISDLRSALQCAIENGRVQIIKVLIAQNPTVVGKLDFLALYRTEHRIFLDSTKLWTGLVSDEAMRSDGKPTTVSTYCATLLPFLDPLVPGMAERLATTPSLSFSDLLFWAVLIGDIKLAECFWQQYMRRGDPVRMALLASQTSLRVSKVSQTETSRYIENARQFEQWACNVLERCHSRQDAMLVLMRPADHWPGTILRVAIDGENKNFVGHKFVQMIVDECWRGNTFGSLYALPATATFLDIVLHLFVPTIEMEPLLDVQEPMLPLVQEANRNQIRKQSTALRRGRTTTKMAGAAETSGGTPKGRGGASPAVTLPLGAGAHRRGTNPISRGRLDLPRSRSFGLMLVTEPSTLMHRFAYSLKACCTRILRPQQESGFRHFFKVPRVKFVLKMVSYCLFLILYFLVLAQRGEFQAEDPDTQEVLHAFGGPHLHFSVLDCVFFLWSFALWVEEMHQWALDMARHESHLGDIWNIIDIVSLSALLLAFFIKLAANVMCESYWEDASLRLGELLAARRELRGSSGHIEPQPLVGDDEPPTHAEIYEATYHSCNTLWTSQVLLSLNAVLCFYRIVHYLTIWPSLGVLVVILSSLFENIATWALFWAIFLVGFSSASLGLMPSLGGGAWTPTGSFFLPWWAMYGEFGELAEVSSAGAAVGTCVLWLWAFSSQILLVNILIAMMTETYEKVKRNADNEHKFSRVYVVDEFAGSVYDIPSPLSLPFLLKEFGTYFYYRFGSYFQASCWRHCCRCVGLRFEVREGEEALSGESLNLEHLLASFERSSDLLTSALSEEELAEIPNAFPDLVMLADLLDEQESLKKGDLAHQIAGQQEALDKVLAKELENQEIILHIDKLHTAQKHIEHMQRANSAAYGTGDSENAGELREQLKEARQKTTKLEAEVLKQQVKDELQQQMLAEARTRASSLEAELATATRRERDLEMQQAARAKPDRHVNARSPHPFYPPRAAVPDDKVSWRSRWPDYSPTAFTAKVVHDNNRVVKKGGWADPPDVKLLREEWARRVSHESNWYFDADGRPLNPRGRTGMCERGLLGKWGANQAADPIVTRLQPKTGRLQMVAVQRKDTGDWAIPGGMVDDGEVVSVTVRREFGEEALNISDETQRRQFETLVDELFATGQVVYRGYVDDPRNTDNAWMETTAFHFHCSAELGAMMPLHAGDDAAAVRWLDVDRSQKDYNNLYASHKTWVDKVAATLSAEM